MKKIIKIISINLILLAVLLFISDLFIYYYRMAHGENYSPHYLFGYTIINPDIAGFNIENYYNNDYKKYKGRFPDGLEYKNNTPVVIFGCSYAFGQDLETTQTLSYKLAQTLKRPVYNRAIPGGSFQHMYFQTSDKGSKYFYKDVPPGDTVIYVMMNDHYQRLIRHVHFNFFKHSFYPVYHLKNNRFVIENYNNPIKNLIKSSYTIKQLNIKFSENYTNDIKNKNKLTEMILQYCLQTKANLEKNWNRKVNFIVVFYPQIKYDKELQKKLEDKGITVINLKDLTQEQIDMEEKYKLPDGHPNEIVWDLVTPIIVNELKQKQII